MGKTCENASSIWPQKVLSRTFSAPKCPRYRGKKVKSSGRCDAWHSRIDLLFFSRELGTLAKITALLVRRSRADHFAPSASIIIFRTPPFFTPGRGGRRGPKTRKTPRHGGFPPPTWRPMGSGPWVSTGSVCRLVPHGAITARGVPAFPRSPSPAWHHPRVVTRRGSGSMGGGCPGDVPVRGVELRRAWVPNFPDRLPPSASSSAGGAAPGVRRRGASGTASR